MRPVKALTLALLLLLPTTSAEAKQCAISHDLHAALNSLSVRAKITSTCGGRHAKRSYHYRRDHHGHTRAVDFRVAARHAKYVYRHMRSHGLCVKHYGGGLFHADNGNMRHW